ncbi:MAG: Ig-like domain-containing protein [Candidatus Cloacimonetes bacterium]|nr:Ig-like domain-containing protein [Candidatus Cloacimonadota bacterium]
MNRAISLALLFLIVSACGHRKAPSGGPRDTVAPEVLDVQPAPLDSLGNRITVVFSKPIDRNSALTGIKLYPLVLDRKLRWPDSQTMIIELREELAEDTNYTLWLGRELKDTHGNALPEPEVFVFRHGKLQQGRIAGAFDWENPELAGLPVQLDLFSADTTFIASWVVNEATFALEHLNIEPHLLRAWADVADDGRYQYGNDLRVEALAPAEQRVSLRLEMAVEDTLPPTLKRAVPHSERQVSLEASEPLVGFASVEVISADSLSAPQEVTHAVLHDTEIQLLLSPMIEGRYLVKLHGARDSRGNRTATDSLFFDALVLPDTLRPEALGSSPRSGAVLTEVLPALTVRFSEIIPAGNALFRLVHDESGREVSLDVLSGDSDIYMLQPSAPLKPYATYRLELDQATTDAAGNPLDGLREFRWIVVPPQEQ